MIKIVKLVTGEDLIADVFEEYTIKSLSLKEPMKFYLDYRNNNSLVMQHYLPIQLVKENQIYIKLDKVLGIIDADNEFVEYYTTTIEKINRLLKAKQDIDKMSDEEIEYIINEFEMENNETGALH